MLERRVLDGFERENVGVKGIRMRWIKKETSVEQLNEVRTMDLDGEC